MSTGRELATLEGEYRDITPLLSPSDARAAMVAYQEIASAVTDENDYQTFRDSDGKQHKFRKRSGWKKLARFYGVATEVKEERIFHDHKPTTCLRVKMPEVFKDVTDCGCPVKGVRYVIRAIDLRSGRYAENVGICVAGERRVPASASLHDLATRALNRGENRAVADLLGVSDPSAEEQQAESGFSKEERTELANLWKGATPERQEKALTHLRSAGFTDPDDRAVYVAFLNRGTDQDYAAVAEMLRGVPESFDPDDVPLGAQP